VLPLVSAVTTLRSVPEKLPLSARIWFAFVCFFRVLFDGAFAARAFAARSAEPALPPAEPPSQPKPRDLGPALQLLSLLQREGRLLDFVQQDITSFPDADVGAAARVVHEGCRRALQSHLKLAPIRSEPEGSSVAVDAEQAAAGLKLIGNLGSKSPERGTLRHRGWRAEALELPSLVGEHDLNVLAPAEVEV
jgi:hypothetical protein